MKDNLKRLNAILKVFNMNDFYTINIGAYEIVLQGHFNADIVKSCLKLKFEKNFDLNGYLEFRRHCYRIVMT